MQLVIIIIMIPMGVLEEQFQSPAYLEAYSLHEETSILSQFLYSDDITTGILTVIILIVLFIALITPYLLLLLMKKIGEYFLYFSIIVGFLITLESKFYVYSNITLLVSDFTYILDGMIIALLWFTPIRKQLS